MVFRGMALGRLSLDVELLVDAGPKSQKPACAGLRLPFREENNLVGALRSRAEILNRKSRALRNRCLIILSAVSDHNYTTRRETRGAFDALSVYSAAWALLTHACSLRCLAPFADVVAVLLLRRFLSFSRLSLASGQGARERPQRGSEPLAVRYSTRFRPAWLTSELHCARYPAQVVRAADARSPVPIQPSSGGLASQSPTPHAGFPAARRSSSCVSTPTKCRSAALSLATREGARRAASCLVRELLLPTPAVPLVRRPVPATLAQAFAASRRAGPCQSLRSIPHPPRA